ncbi:pitrilysin family protein [Prochlorococcus sp. MIT 0801]|uniref:M16 family metallopeptidase n=1 Tax=Prochlorococcus sp. MIT 0801 TaxID=1501269 RepID=UPI0004F7FBF7|nr:pitrilysin family protein [Prochlorococcus sp. MIT 0801]AIQ96923.1 Insulinase family (Peptidase family M16) [Prochlorococcus sp. MIT 0801]
MNIILDKLNSKNIMSAKLWIEDGSRNDPKDKKGIHQLLSSTMLRGCGPYNNKQIAEIVESCGASLNCDTYEDGILISLKCVENDAYTLFPLIGWMITKPLLQVDQFDLEKDLTIKAIKRQKESTYQLAFDAWRKMIYGDGPYGHDPLGSINDIKKINKEHILPIASSLIHRKKNLVISGKFPINLDKYIENSIEFMGISKNINKQKKTINNVNKTERLLKQKRSICTHSLNTKQVILLLGKATIRYDNKSDILLRLLSCYLGYGMSSLLFKVLREKYGVVYEAGVYHPIRESQTPFIMHASTSEEKGNITLQLLKECWEKIINCEISPEELYLVKMKYRGQMAHSLQSISQRAEHKAHLLGIGLTKDHDKEILKRLESITSKEIKDAANRYLKNPFLSVCSNKEVIRKIVKDWKV